MHSFDRRKHPYAENLSTDLQLKDLKAKNEGFGALNITSLDEINEDDP